MRVEFFQKALSLFLPKTCVICDQAGSVLCVPCSASIRLNLQSRCSQCFLPFVSSPLNHLCTDCSSTHPSFDQHISLVTFDHRTSKWIYDLKYQSKFWIEEIFYEALQQIDIPFQIDVIVPIPLHRTKLKQRGFNQSQRLGLVVSQVLDRPMNLNLVSRLRKTESQTGLSRSERMQNVKNAFECSQKQRIPESVVLIDDVYTTGSTLNEAARVLKQAGVQRVYALTFALREKL